MADRLLKLRDVAAKVGVANSTIYEWMREDHFPRPKQLGPRRVAWQESEIDAWIESLPRRERAD